MRERDMIQLSSISSSFSAASSTSSSLPSSNRNWKLAKKIIAILFRIIIAAISFGNWILGTVAVVYIVWILNSGGGKLSGFITGRSLVSITTFVYGAFVCAQGIVGVFAAATCHRRQQQSPLLKAFLFLAIMSVSIEIGTFISIRVTESIPLSTLIEQTWSETNLQSRNYIQRKYRCCGLTGLSEFASRLDPIDDSCYDDHLVVVAIGSKIDHSSSSARRQPFRVGCKSKLIDWLQRRQRRFVSFAIALLVLQIVSIVLTLILLRHDVDDDDHHRRDAKSFAENRSAPYRQQLLR